MINSNKIIISVQVPPALALAPNNYYPLACTVPRIRNSMSSKADRLIVVQVPVPLTSIY